jgi:hypothetical protein
MVKKDPNAGFAQWIELQPFSDAVHECHIDP